jgi:hypothetical protein
MFLKLYVVWWTRLGGTARWCGWCCKVVAPSVMVVLMMLVHISQRGLYVRYELCHYVTGSKCESSFTQMFSLTSYYPSFW